jgi:hypothetical protein
MYYHGESINVNVQATNNSNKTVKKIKISSINHSVRSFKFGRIGNPNKKNFFVWIKILKVTKIQTKNKI